MNSIQRRPLAEQAAEALLARIEAGEWAVGHRLPGETTLAAQLEVGRSTVREAIRGLAGRGILESRQGAGVFVLSGEPVEEWDAVLRRADIVAVVEARIAIEAEAAAHAATRRTDDDLERIRAALVRRHETTGGDAVAHVDADTAFHRAVVSAAHNDVVTELFDAFVPRIHRAMIDLLRISPGVADEADHAAHESLYLAIRDRDARAASETSRAHLQRLQELHT